MRKFTSLNIVLILWFAGLCSAAQFAKIAHIIPELEVIYPHAGSSLGFLLSLISLVGACLGLMAGLLVSYIGPRKILIIGLASGTLISLLQSVSLPLDIFLISRAFEGASHLAIVVAAPTLIAHHSSDKMRTAAMTLWGTFFGVSFAITAWLGLPIATEHGVHSLILTHAILMAISTLLVVWMIPKQIHKTNSAFSWSQSLQFIYTLHKDSWTSPSIAAPASGWLFYTITFVALLSILPTLLPPEQRSFASTTLPLVSIITSMTLGVLLLKKFTAIQILCAGFVAAIFFALFYLISEQALFIIILFAALGLVQGASFASIPQLNKRTSDQALANGAFAQAGNLGNLCGTPLLLLVLNSNGLHAMITLVLMCYIAAIIVHAIFARKRKMEKIAI